MNFIDSLYNYYNHSQRICLSFKTLGNITIIRIKEANIIMSRVRRTKIEVVQQKIVDIELKIKSTEDKLIGYKKQLNELNNEMKKIIAAEEKSKEKEKLNEIMNLIKNSSMNLDEIKIMISKEVHDVQE